MHPILARGRSLALYLVAFAQAGVLLAEILVRTTAASRVGAYLVVLPPVVAYALGCLASWYLCRRLPLAATPAVRVLGAHAAAGAMSAALFLALVALWGALLRALAEPVFGGMDPADLVRAQAPLLLVFGFLLYSLIAAVHYVQIALENERKAEARAFELRLSAREAELRALKAQVDPHFLFNSLNAVAALTVPEPARARRMCLALAGFLRHSLRHAAADTIALADEVALAERYLEIERERFGDRLDVRVRLAPACADRLVPPLVLQPLVENAVKHGIAPMLEGGTVSIDVADQGGATVIEVRNPCDPDRRQPRGEGIGLANVAQRLAAIHGPEATLEAEEKGATFRVVVRLPPQEEVEA